MNFFEKKRNQNNAHLSAVKIKGGGLKLTGGWVWKLTGGWVSKLKGGGWVWKLMGGLGN